MECLQALLERRGIAPWPQQGLALLFAAACAVIATLYQHDQEAMPPKYKRVIAQIVGCL
jgi:hypothetical protein